MGQRNVPLPFVANMICTGKHGILQNEHQDGDVPTARAPSSPQGIAPGLQTFPATSWVQTCQLPEGAHPSERWHSIQRTGLTRWECMASGWLIKNCGLCARGGARYHGVVGNQITHFSFWTWRILLSHCLAAFFLFPCCTVSSEKHYIMANLADNLGDPWLQKIILKYTLKYITVSALVTSSQHKASHQKATAGNWILTLPCEICFLTELTVEYVKTK